MFQRVIRTITAPNSVLFPWRSASRYTVIQKCQGTLKYLIMCVRLAYVIFPKVEATSVHVPNSLKVKKLRNKQY